MKNNQPFTMKRTSLAAAVALCTLLGSTSSQALDFNGYFRSGIFTSTDGSQTSWVDHKLGRFGNETDGWYDLMLGQTIYQNDEGQSFSVHTTLDGNIDQGKSWNPVDSSGPNSMQFLDMYADAKGFIAAAPEATLWAGRRSYDKREIQMLDFKPVAIAGTGVGLQGIDAGPGKLSLAWMREDAGATTRDVTGTSDAGDFNGNYIDVRYAKLPVFGDATLEVIADYLFVNKTDAQDDSASTGEIYNAKNAFQPTLILTKPLDNGFNETTLQYADHVFANDMTKLGYNEPSFDASHDYSDAKAYRVINTGEAYLTDNIVMAHTLMYVHGSDTYSDVSSSAQKWDKVDSYTALIRPAYIWNKNNKTAVELGWFRQKATVNGNDLVESGKKITLAHVLTMGPSLLSARPDFRFYTTYIKADNNELDNVTFDGKDHQLSFGVQAEVWW